LLIHKIKSQLVAKFIRLAQIPRIFKYKLLSNCKVIGEPRLLQPAQLVGNGEIHFKGTVNIGVFPSPHFFNGYAYIEARNPGAKIIIGDGTWMNNNFVAISEYKSITIGKNVLIGTFVEIYDSNFHGLEPDQRQVSSFDESSEVIIEDNVFLGSNVKVLKGVTIGQNSVIANGSLVTKSIPPGVVAGGSPARVIKKL
jgi:maltose O-acetyltransferase